MSTNVFQLRCHLARLPNELKTTILAMLPDFVTLRSFVLVSSDFYWSFKAEEGEIVRQDLLREIPRPLFEESVALQEVNFDRVTRWLPPQTKEFLKKYSSRASDFLRTCDLPQALELVQYHRTVQNLAHEFAEPAFAIAGERFAEVNESLHLSLAEKIRVQRAFFRFELYFAFFGDPERRVASSHSGEQAKAFWVYFPVWLIEQIACVYDDLWSSMAITIEDLALANKYWFEYTRSIGAFQVCDRYLTTHLAPRMVRGLSHLEHFLKEGEDALTIDLDDDFKIDSDTIEHSLECSVEYDGEAFTRPLGSNVPTLAREVFTGIDSIDQDPGPESAWRWAYQDSNEFVFGDSQAPLRDWAYVFWDHWRLDQWQVLNRPWTSDGEKSISCQREERSKKMLARLDALEEAADERECIWYNG